METVSKSRAEMLVIWDALQNPDIVKDLALVVKPYMFGDEELKAFWSKIVDQSNSGQPLGMESVSVSLSREKCMTLFENMCDDGVLGSLNQASAFRLLYIKNLAYNLGSDLIKSSTEAANPDAVLAMARRFVDAVEGAFSGQTTRTILEAVNELGEQLKAVKTAADNGEATAITTGFRFLDEHFKGGLRGGNILILAARPGIGKTSVMLAMMRAAVGAGFKCKIYSLEMSHTELAEKIMYNLGGLYSQEMLTGTPDWEGRWSDAVSILQSWGMYIEDSLSNVDDIISDIAVSHQRGRCDIAFIDYLGLMSVSDDHLSIYQATCEKTRKLKRLALAQKLPLVVNCQLNRDSVKEQRDPDLQDLRDSGSIEQDADKIVFLSRKKVDSDRFQIKMIIGKNRQGGGVYQHIFLNPNSTYSAFEETATAESSMEDREEDDERNARADELNNILGDLPF